MPKLALELNDGTNIHYNDYYLEAYKEKLTSFLSGLEYLQTLKFAKQMMLFDEIKYNNTIEGINDDLSIIEAVIKDRKSATTEEGRKRITNLYHGYQYILNNKGINKESLKELYAILSKGLLPSDTLMGEYYRVGEVYIEDEIHLYDKGFKGIPPENLNHFMELFFNYVNSSEPSSEIDIFLKSQIMHFYFVYIHPYYDVNGRTGRTVSMWYLLNNEAYPFIIFNRAISFAKKEYYKRIEEGRMSGNLTLFLRYILVVVERELEKAYLILSIKKNSGIKLSNEEIQTLEYYLSLNGSIKEGNLTVKDLARVYNRYNNHKSVYEIYMSKVKPLIEKGILLSYGQTKSLITSDFPNFHLGLNPEFLDIDPSKVENLKLERCLKKN